MSSQCRVVILHSEETTKYAHDLGSSLRAELAKSRISPPTILSEEQARQNSIDFLDKAEQYNTVLLVVQGDKDRNLWRDIINNTKSRDPHAELILICTDEVVEVINPVEVLRGGYYAYFQPQYQSTVLNAYIIAANDRISRRKDRFESSSQLNENIGEVATAAQTVLEQLKKLVDYDRATISLLSERTFFFGPNGGYVPSVLLRTLLHHRGYEEVNWWLQRPIEDDELIRWILSENVNRSVYPDPKNELRKRGWEIEHAQDVNSWIVLPLRYLDGIVGIITLDAIGQKKFSYETVNEIVLRQFANQAALTILSAQQFEAVSRLQSALKAVAEQTDRQAILDKIAEEACKLVDGLFSYVVLPDNGKLSYVSVYTSLIDRGRLLSELQQNLSFSIPPSEEAIQPEQGITLLAYLRRQNVIVDDCLGVFRRPNENQSCLAAYDLSAYRDYKAFGFDDHKTQSNIAIPIIDDSDQTIGGNPRVLGVINIEHQHPCAFTDSQIAMLEEFATFAAIAIKTHDAKKRMQRLFKASNDATSIISGRNMLDELAKETKQAAGADGGVKIFALVDDETILRGYSDTFDKDSTQTRGKAGQTWWLIERAQEEIGRQDKVARIVIPDVSDYDSSKYRGITINEATEKAGHRALLCLPLWLGSQKVVGAMWLHYRSPKQFTEEELQELQLYANRSAIALHNEKERKLLQISEEIGKKDNRQSMEIAQEIVDYVKEAFGVLGAVFYLDDPDKKQLRLYATTKDADNRPHMPVDKTVKHGEGLAGHHYLGEDLDGVKYSEQAIHIAKYGQEGHFIVEDLQEGKLHSLFSIRLVSPLTHRTIGILILNDKEGRNYSASKDDLLRFANLASNLLALVEFEELKSSPREIGLRLIVMALVVIIVIVAPVIIQDTNTNLLVRFLAMLALAVAYLLFSSDGKALWRWASKHMDLKPLLKGIRGSSNR